MSTKKIERALYGPSMTEVVLGAIIGIVLGAVLGAASLIVKPAELVAKLPDEPAKGTVYVIEGAKDTAGGRQGNVKRQAFMNGGGVSMTEAELNAAIGSVAKAGGGADASAAAMLAPGLPNFRIEDGKLQIAVPTTLSVAGFNFPVLVVGRGAFENRGGGFAFVPDEFQIGSLNATQLPFLKGFVTSRLIAASAPAEDVAAAWGKLRNVSIEGNSLTLATQ